ncbi:hypothetical protein MMC26_005444 [Xylographa opegraphella]|nr:hypothetical protein [Xylographa opegraphella]
MPHTARKKNRSIQKHRNIEGDDGWTHVTRGSNHHDFRHTHPPGLVMPSLHGTEEDEERIPKSIVRRGLTEDKMKQLLATTARRWTDSTSSTDIKAVFTRQLSKHGNLDISSCVCLALGSFTTDDFHGRPGASMHQLLALEAMLQFLGPKHGINKVYFQDPCFNDLDEKVLRSRGYSVLPRPTALKYITSSTFLYAPFAIWTSLISALQTTDPVLVITNDIGQHLRDREQYPNGDYGYSQEGGETVLRNFIKSRTSFTLPRSTGSSQIGLNDLTIYWKPDPTEDDSLN